MTVNQLKLALRVQVLSTLRPGSDPTSLPRTIHSLELRQEPVDARGSPRVVLQEIPATPEQDTPRLGGGWRRRGETGEEVDRFLGFGQSSAPT